MSAVLFVEEPIAITLAATPWNDRVLGGATAHATLADVDAYAGHYDLRRRQLWLAEKLAAGGYVYVSTTVAADDHHLKTLVQHLGFDFVYQTTTCILRLTDAHAAYAGHEQFRVVNPQEVPVEEARELCARTMRNGRFQEDWLTHELAGQRHAAFITDLHTKVGTHRIFTRSPDGHLNGYAYIPLDGSSADLMMMGIDERHSVAGGGEIFWRTCLGELARHKVARRVHTRVPAANLGVLNIYAQLGFSYIRPSYDFRMFPRDLISGS